MARYHDRGDQGTVPELYSVFAGEVTSIQQYGAFIKIPRCKKNGLVHKSHISNSRVEDVSDVLALGDKVYCKVISLGDEGDDKVKISLSMKNINQDDGTDLDPNQVQLVQDEKRRKKSGTYIPEKIELGVVLNTTCRKCGCKGHLAQDCFKIPGGKSYELLPEDDSFLTALSQPTPSDKSSHKKKKKKDKKHKNKKKHKHRDNDSESGF
ncbi:zinc finger CCHC domain-containing protein 17-like [Saccoglossus kowalevskii]|uniref:Nucleolar protein of 40 kDa-like isoform X2 n=1 Tax=Saccoglossus kowalevskii TaxID=10224 RepID=A0ABM0LVJ3_SACKO|nr:PREDICTED: nucleolar protein of 40 kDa-like isoform X2 [Saccoglossus kowalevskii]